MQNVDEDVIEITAFDASSDNYEDFDQNFDASKLGKKLTQANVSKGSLREYQFYGAKHLLLNFTEGKKAVEKKFRIDLAYVSAEPEHKKLIVWNWLYATLVATALMCLFIFLAVKDIINLEYSLIGGAITLTTAVICLLIFIYLMRDEYIFKSQFGNIELFLMDNMKPNQKDFDEFFIVLQQKIDKAQSGESVSDRLVAELKMCRRLKDEAIINDETYTSARTAIFKNKEYKA